VADVASAHMGMRLRTTLFMGLAAWASLHAGPAWSELEYGAGYSFARDSNITHDPNNPTPEQTHVGFIGLAYLENSASLNAKVLAQAEARKFVNGVYSDDSALYLDADAVWTLLPKRFSWTVQDVHRETILDLRLPDTPSNRTATNSFSTGPDLTLQLNATNSFNLAARYGSYYVDGPGDNRRVSGTLSFLHSLSAGSVLSLNYEGMQIQYPAPSLYESVQRDDLYARYDVRSSALNAVQAELGATRVEPKGGVTKTGPHAKFSYTRQLTQGSSLRIALANVLSDTYTDLITTSTTSPTVAGSGDVYERQSATANYTAKGSRLGFGAILYANRYDYDILPQDYDEWGTRALLTWEFSIDLRANAYAKYLEREYRSFVRSDEEVEAGLSVTYYLTRSLSATLEGVRDQTNSTDPRASFVNDRWTILFGYSTGLAYVPRSRR